MVKFIHAPQDHHFQVVKRTILYVKSTLHFGLHISPSTNLSISTYSDANWIGDSLVSWTSKRQSMVSRSSVESKYKALALTEAEVKWPINILYDLQIQTQEQPTLILFDNTSALFMSRNLNAQK
ncbi:hypothetical protein SADUNF_Sadunf04G0088900 [Salix dunnii]|uniref:Uncharacterized protein n=1 Tax=Salix dunnii TaxID=1413687 RepID=A0A835KE34_9ROSI|nr:hypothetical protein SADUNF_Sadunf04G0088900 [Salix dunnii]